MVFLLKYMNLSLLNVCILVDDIPLVIDLYTTRRTGINRVVCWILPLVSLGGSS